MKAVLVSLSTIDTSSGLFGAAWNMLITFVEILVTTSFLEAMHDIQVHLPWSIPSPSQELLATFRIHGAL